MSIRVDRKIFFLKSCSNPTNFTDPNAKLDNANFFLNQLISQELKVLRKNYMK